MKINIHTSFGNLGVGRIVQLSLTHREHAFTSYWGGGDEGMTLFNSCQGAKELGPNQLLHFLQC